MLISVSRPEEVCVFLTGSAGTGKTLMLSEALKIKLSRLRNRGTDVKIFVTTFHRYDTELLDKYRSHYLVNIDNINFTDIKQLCDDLNIEYDQYEPQSTMNNVVRSLSDKYTDSTVILLCDEVQCMRSPDWSNMKTCHNVIWLLAINPYSNGADMNIVYPTSDDVFSQQLQIKYRNCHQIR